MEKKRSKDKRKEISAWIMWSIKRRLFLIAFCNIFLFFWLQSRTVISITLNCKRLVIVPTTPSKFSVLQTISARDIFFYFVENGHKSKDGSFEEHDLLYYFKYFLLEMAKQFKLWILHINTIFYLNTVCSYK